MTEAGQQFLDMLEGLDNYYDNDFPQDPFLNWEQITQHYDVKIDEFTGKMELTPKVDVVKNVDGSVRSYDLKTEISNNSDIAQGIDSNAQTQTTSEVSVPCNTAVNSETQTVDATTGLQAAGGGTVAAISLKDKIIPALVAVGTLITLGKITTPELYENLPNIFKEDALEQFDPEEWGEVAILRERESVSDNRYSIYSYFVSDGEGSGSVYVDTKALAYFVKYAISKGVFSQGHETVDTETLDNFDLSTYFNFPLTLVSYTDVLNYRLRGSGNQIQYISAKPYAASKICLIKDHVNQSGYTMMRYLVANTTSATTKAYFGYSTVDYVEPNDLYAGSIRSWTYDNKTVYYYLLDQISGLFIDSNISPNENINENLATNNDMLKRVAWLMMYDYEEAGGGVEGIEDEEGAVTPSFSNDDDYDDILRKIAEAYPDLMARRAVQSVVQPDGSIKEYVYLPIVLPTVNPTPTDDSDPEEQPISGTQRQEDDKIETETTPETIIEYVVQVTTTTPTLNDENTGSGDTPAVVIPTGSAEALYKVYNPSQSAINDFGAWLWSSNFVDQILKMFSDPMQAVISLHKIFCTPSTSGTANIKVGYLDSGVSSYVVDEQYVTINCGTVNLLEEFKNVLDYPPYTEISLFLPFIGIVRLDTNDVMRSSITITYHVDVLTGACLAEVSIIRDMFGGVLYQYAGDCSVHYPLSSGSYMGIVGALLGVAGTVASGGTLAPMALGVASGIMGARSSVKRSGGFSGNAGAMGSKKPYLIIQRPQPNLANVFETFVGKPANYTTKIKYCTGYISCTEAHIENCNGTDSELAELESL